MISCIFMAFFYSSHTSNIMIRDNSVNGAKRYLEALSEFRTLYTSEVIKTAKEQGITITHDYLNQENAIPLPATFSMMLGERIGQHQSGAKTFLYSRHPFPWRKKENQKLFSQSFPQDAWKALNHQPETAFYRFETFDGRASIRYAVADRMRESCIDCHNNHADTPKNDWQVGDVRGVMEVILPVDVAQSQVSSNIRGTFLILGLMSVLMVCILSLVFNRLKKDQKDLFAKNEVLIHQKDEIEIQNTALNTAKQSIEHQRDELILSNQYKSEFLACMSHEIRTPINGILGMLSLLNKSPLNSDQQRKTGLALSSAESLISLINDILDFSKVDAGKMELEALDFNLRTQLEMLTGSQALKAQGKGVELILDISAITDTMVLGDPSRIRQVFTNLITNAIKFTETGEVKIQVALIETDDNTLMLNASITDTGIGIPEEGLKALFDSFTQVDASTTRQYGGTGLGLSIVKKLCELMKGDVSVTSKLGKGSCFSVSIPMLPSNSSESSAPDFDVSGLSLLIVDDNNSQADTLAKQLRAWGVEVTIAIGAKAALIKCTRRLHNNSQSLFDAAFIDFNMPDIDGSQLCKLLNANEQYQSMKLILMTLSSQASNNYMDSIGCHASFPKPINSKDLITALKCIMTLGESNDETDSRLMNIEESKLVNDQQMSQHPWPEDCRILLVDDNHINLEVALGILAEIGLTADIANNGQEAIECLNQTLENDFYTLILLDCQMPVMDGYMASKAIREGFSGENYKNITIIAMTANAMAGDREKCLQAGMNDYLSKPINNIDMLSMLKKWLLNVDTEPKITKTYAAKETKRSETLVIWDQQDALKRFGSKEKRLFRIASLFLQDASIELKKLESFVAQESWSDISNQAHNIKGMAANISAYKLAHIAHLMEGNTKDAPDINEVHDQCRKIRVAIDEVCQKIEQYLADSTNK